MKIQIDSSTPFSRKLAYPPARSRGAATTKTPTITRRRNERTSPRHGSVAIQPRVEIETMPCARGHGRFNGFAL